MLCTTPIVAQLIGEEPWFAIAPKPCFYFNSGSFLRLECRLVK
jgi:hypothetical protein